jgi:signal peptidase II
MGLRDSGSLAVFPPFLNFRMAWNTGINFGLLSNNADAARWIPSHWRF